MLRPATLLAFVIAFACCASVTPAETPTAPKAGPEVKRLAVMVGKFTNEGEMRAGAMGPNSPAQKATGTDDCRWVAGEFGILCNSTVDVGGMKATPSFTTIQPRICTTTTQ